MVFVVGLTPKTLAHMIKGTIIETEGIRPVSQVHINIKIIKLINFISIKFLDSKKLTYLLKTMGLFQPF